MAAALFGFLKTPEDFACLRTGLGAVRGACRLERSESGHQSLVRLKASLREGYLLQHTRELGILESLKTGSQSAAHSHTYPSF